MKYCPTCNAKYDDSVSFCANDGEVLEDDATHIVGSTLDGQYHIESLLGKGGMGAVYRARHILLGDRVAIKVLPPQMRNNAEWLRRFRREGQAARRFRHPNAVTVYDLRTTSDGLIYMVMEFVEGHTLDAELKRRGRFSPLEALTALEPVMSVLNAAHAMGVVHRDLKPENIMLGKPGEDGLPVTKLLDLGIAKMREVAGAEASGTTALTIAGQVLGTPFYMSPEQWGEVPADGNMEIDGRADIYSLAVVIYELIAGKRPFLGLTLQELRREHVTVKARPLQEAAPDVPEAFSRAIARAMSKERSERQATAGEFAAELRAALGLPALAGSSPSINLVGGAQASASAAHELNPSSQTTNENLEGRNTSADVIGPTIITVDAPPRRQAESAPAPPLLDATSLAQPAHPAYQAAPTPPQQPDPNFPSFGAYAESYAPAAETPRRSSKMPLIIAVLAVLLIGGGVGAWYFLSNRNSANTAENVNNSKAAGETEKKGPANTGDSGGGTTSTPQESLNYWLEIAEAGPNGDSARIVGGAPLASGQAFKFHFTPRTDGYIYIIGSGEKGVPTTFLTDKPIPDYAKTNEIKAGVDYIFPIGDEGWIELDAKPGTESYTIIFSPTRLTEPAFLTEEAGQELTTTEQKVLEDFRAKYKANAPTTNVINGGGTEPLVSVKVPQAATGEPVIFDVRLEHK
ncbi:MAG TPA: protein kinase [Pyrinomonadaceae bacterium]